MFIVCVNLTEFKDPKLICSDFNFELSHVFPCVQAMTGAERSAKHRAKLSQDAQKDAREKHAAQQRLGRASSSPAEKAQERQKNADQHRCNRAAESLAEKAQKRQKDAAQHRGKRCRDAAGYTAHARTEVDADGVEALSFGMKNCPAPNQLLHSQEALADPVLAAKLLVHERLGRATFPHADRLREIPDLAELSDEHRQWIDETEKEILSHVVSAKDREEICAAWDKNVTRKIHSAVRACTSCGVRNFSFTYEDLAFQQYEQLRLNAAEEEAVSQYGAYASMVSLYRDVESGIGYWVHPELVHRDDQGRACGYFCQRPSGGGCYKSIVSHQRPSHGVAPQGCKKELEKQPLFGRMDFGHPTRFQKLGLLPLTLIEKYAISRCRLLGSVIHLVLPADKRKTRVLTGHMYELRV